MTRPDDARSVDNEEIRLSLPALFRYGRVARLAVTGLASRNGFSYDDVEDLRIAIGEAFAVLVPDERDDERLVLTCTVQATSLAVTAERLPPRPINLVTDLSRRILEALVDEAVVTLAAGTIRLTKRLPPS